MLVLLPQLLDLLLKLGNLIISRLRRDDWKNRECQKQGDSNRPGQSLIPHGRHSINLFLPAQAKFQFALLCAGRFNKSKSRCPTVTRCPAIPAVTTDYAYIFLFCI
jgi:hypothetical protein